MEYIKPHLSFDAQAELLIRRGLIADKALLINRLKNVNYYRFSGYLYPFRLPNSHEFKEGTTFEQVWRHYAFDRRLRTLIIDAIERIEVGIRTQLIYHFSNKFGPFGYCNQNCFPKLKKESFEKWLKELSEEAYRSREIFINHFRNNYGDKHSNLPIWMIGEIMSFGKILTMFNGVSDSIRQLIAYEYGIGDKTLQSWLGTLNVIRNICAHHGRLWNRELDYKPHIPKINKYPKWHYPVPIHIGNRIAKETIILEVPEIKEMIYYFFEHTDNVYLTCKQSIKQLIGNSNISVESKIKLEKITQPSYRIFLVLTILLFFLKKIAPQSAWKLRLMELLDEYPEISRWSMGFPDNWKESLLWQ